MSGTEERLMPASSPAEDELVEIIAAQMWLDAFGLDSRRDWNGCVREAEEYGPESAAAMQVYQWRARAKRFADAIRPWLTYAIPAAPQATEEPVAWDRGQIAKIAFLVRHSVELGRYEEDERFEEALHDWGKPDNLDRIRKEAFADADAILKLAAPAASRIGVTEEEITRALDLGVCGICQRDCEGDGTGSTPLDCDKRCSWYEPSRERQIKRLLALLAAPRAGGETVHQPYTLQSGEGGTFLQAEAGQLFICADINTVRRCLAAIGAPSAEHDANRGGGR